MIINTSYYRSGSLHIPNNDVVSRTRNGDVAPVNALQSLIDIKEREYIVNTLNVSYYNEIIDNLDPQGAVLVTAPEWVKFLLNGTTYTIDGKSKVWDGLRHPQSCLVYYLFTKWLEDDQFTTLQIGVSQLKDSASMRVNPSDFHQQQWNNFVYKHQANQWHELNHLPMIVHYPNGTLIDFYNEPKNNGFASCLEFIKDYEMLNDGTFTDINEKRYELINHFGL